MTLWIILALSVGLFLFDGWTQYRMQTTHGGKGYEANPIYGTRYPSFGRYALLNFPVLVGFTAIALALRFLFHQSPLVSSVPLMCGSAYHVYGSILNMEWF